MENSRDVTSIEFAPALFWAGRYESLTGDDEREYIVDCFMPSQELTNKLFEAQEAYIMSDRRDGYIKMIETRPLFKKQLAHCPRVWTKMDPILRQADGLISDPDWNQIQQDIYVKKKKAIDRAVDL